MSATPLLPSAPNFRDFGGYAARDGRRVHQGRLFRSELLLGLGETELQTVAGLGIGLVCDLRSPAERRMAANQWPAQCPFESLALDLGSELSAVQPDKWSRRLADPGFDATRAHEALLDNYRRMPASFAADLKELFTRLGTPGAPPLLVHCAAGKDRTGFVVASILRALDVPWDTVLRDYLVTAERYTLEHLIETRIRILLPGHHERSARMDEALAVLASVHPAFLQAAFDEIEATFGGLDAYLSGPCGLDGHRREALRSALLAPA